MTEHDEVAVGIAWYRETDYPILQSMFEDGQVLPANYQEWLVKAQAAEDQVRRAGQIVERVFIEPVSFPRWCESHGLSMDAKARTRFACEEARMRHGGTPS